MTQEILNRARQRHTLTAVTLAGLVTVLIAALTVAAVVVSIGIVRA